MGNKDAISGKIHLIIDVRSKIVKVNIVGSDHDLMLLITPASQNN